MTDNKRNDWEFPIDNSKIKEKKDYDLNGIYEHAHSELSLQQSKRDQIITIYLALCSLLLPFALGEKIIITEMKGVIFLILGIVGVLFSFITVRYREYKEVYWLCCQSLTVLLSFKTEEMDKALVQRVFYHCLRKKGKGYLVEKRCGIVMNRRQYVKKNIFSSETLHFAIVNLMCSFISGLGIALVLTCLPVMNIIIALAVGILIFIYLFTVYFGTCLKVYGSLEERRREGDAERRNKAFNKAFSKAWFLHFYYDEK